MADTRPKRMHLGLYPVSIRFGAELGKEITRRGERPVIRAKLDLLRHYKLMNDPKVAARTLAEFTDDELDLLSRNVRGVADESEFLQAVYKRLGLTHSLSSRLTLMEPFSRAVLLDVLERATFQPAE